MISVLVSDTWKGADVLTVNPKTIWVSLPDGHVIKRHKVKHRMRELIEPAEVEEPTVEVRLPWWRRLLNWLKGVWK